MGISHLISKRASAREVSHFTKESSEGKPEGFTPHKEPLSLLWGMPNNGFFPVDSLEVTLVDYPFQKSLALPVTNASLESLALNGSDSGAQTATPPLSVVKNTFVTERHAKDRSKTIDLTQGLQYSETNGMPQLVKFTRDFMNRVHKPKFEDWDTIITTGAGDGLNKAAEVLLDIDDVVLIEEFTFTPFLQNVEQAGGIPVPIKLNITNGSNGIDLDYLKDLLENWSTLKPDLKKPKALYTIATGQNPTGLTQTLEFRKEIYALAEKYDFAIIEDDPYGYLSLPAYRPPQGIFQLKEFLTVDEYIADHLVPSYLTIDTTGRVIRIETFSKLFAPGLRLGFMVAHKDFINAISNYQQVVTRFPSGPSQIIVNNVIQNQLGGVDGWLQWILKMRITYTHRRDVLFYAIADSEAYRKKYIELVDPKAGMFLAVVIKFPENTDILAKIKLLNWKLKNFGVGAVLGLNMAVDAEFSKERANFLRLTYAFADNDDELREAGKRLAAAIADFFEKGLEY